VAALINGTYALFRQLVCPAFSALPENQLGILQESPKTLDTLLCYERRRPTPEKVIIIRSENVHRQASSTSTSRSPNLYSALQSPQGRFDSGGSESDGVLQSLRLYSDEPVLKSQIYDNV